MSLPRPVIQVGTGGLISLLGIQNGGINPPNLGDVLAPTFDLQEWYLRAQQEWVFPEITAAVPNGASGGFAVGFVTIPTTEWWYVRHFSAQINTAAGDSIAQCALAVRGPNSTAHVVSGQLATIANSINTIFAPSPFWVPPGGSLGMFVGTAVVAGATQAFGRFVITRVRS